MFDLSQYETVDERIHAFYAANPVGKITTEILELKDDFVVIRASVFREHEDTLPAATGICDGSRKDRGVDANFWIPNAETSAIGRALANLGLSAKGARPSRSEMEKVQAVAESKPAPTTFKEKLAEKITVENVEDPWTTKTVDAAPAAAMSVDEVAKAIGAKVLTDDPTCKHGNRIWATGVSKAGKPWGHWKCDNRPMNGERWADVEKCDPIWYDISPSGTWQPRKA